jgi:hypothetical protein
VTTLEIPFLADGSVSGTGAEAVKDVSHTLTMSSSFEKHVPKRCESAHVAKSYFDDTANVAIATALSRVS